MIEVLTLLLGAIELVGTPGDRIYLMNSRKHFVKTISNVYIPNGQTFDTPVEFLNVEKPLIIVKVMFSLRNEFSF